MLADVTTPAATPTWATWRSWSCHAHKPWAAARVSDGWSSRSPAHVSCGGALSRPLMLEATVSRSAACCCCSPPSLRTTSCQVPTYLYLPLVYSINRHSTPHSRGSGVLYAARGPSDFCTRTCSRPLRRNPIPRHPAQPHPKWQQLLRRGFRPCAPSSASAHPSGPHCNRALSRCRWRGW